MKNEVTHAIQLKRFEVLVTSYGRNKNYEKKTYQDQSWITIQRTEDKNISPLKEQPPKTNKTNTKMSTKVK